MSSIAPVPITRPLVLILPAPLSTLFKLASDFGYTLVHQLEWFVLKLARARQSKPGQSNGACIRRIAPDPLNQGGRAAERARNVMGGNENEDGQVRARPQGENRPASE
ncbi:hypothetical protein FS749_013434 [Ceratobasidium sp. UAMH 11750]|nr:hypothetical protein FS749_013434 [Ceratobasidium sp. UAMH 11750]